MRTFAIREDLVVGLLQYLAKRPFDEVETAVTTLRALQEVQLTPTPDDIKKNLNGKTPSGPEVKETQKVQ